MPVKVKSPQPRGPTSLQRVNTGGSSTGSSAGPSASPVAQSAAPGSPGRAAKRKTPYLSRRKDGRFYFMRRFPQPYLDRGIFKQPTYRKSLGTTDRLSAERKARQLAARFDRVIEWLESHDLRHGVVQVPRRAAEVNGDDVKAIAHRFETLLLHSDDLDRQERWDCEELRSSICDVETQRAQVCNANQHGDFAASTADARSVVATEHPTSEVATDAWRDLLKGMTQAQLKALRGILQPQGGDEPAEIPKAHPPIRAEDDFDDLDR
jgi:PAS domain-containing protein